MERFRYDRSSKWLIDHHGDAILSLAGVRDIEAWRSVQSEVVQPRQLPDGLIEVRRKGETQFRPYIIEIESYPDRRTPEDLLDDLMLVYQDRRVLPEIVALILHPKGRVQVESGIQKESVGRLTTLSATWTVTELWTLHARDLMATGDPGLMPWVPLTQIDGPIEPVLQQCRQIIDEKAKPTEHDNLLAVTQVLMGLNYNDPNLLRFFGGKEAMIDSPVLNNLIAEREALAVQKVILGLLEDRFEAVPEDVALTLKNILNSDRLLELTKLASKCPDLDTFRQQLTS